MPRKRRKPVGRPRIPVEEKKVRVTVTLSKTALHGIEASRGKLPRSKFIQSVLESSGVYATAGISRERKLNGAVYTPPKLANYLASKLIGFFLKDFWSEELRRSDNNGGSRHPHRLRVLDPACGEGELLIAIWQQLCIGLSQAKDRRLKCLKLRSEDVLCGIDIDPMAILKTGERIKSLPGLRPTYNQSLHLQSANALFPLEEVTSADGWREVLAHFGATDGFDLIIANAPWGADVSAYKSRLEQGEFKFFQGQYDSSDLFIELALRVLRPGGYFAFIVPDSLFSHERMFMRKTLVEHTQIMFIARLGEKIFENINRACALIICRKCQPDPSLETECLRLTPAIRKRILEGNMDFADAERILAHRVPQGRFMQNRDYLFDIDVTSHEEGTIRSFGMVRGRFGDFLQSTRGIELSKSGKVYQCEKCQLWLPLPSAAEPKCPHCESGLLMSPSRIACIVSNDKSERYKPLLVGENVRRYTIRSNYWIDPKKDGLNYKSGDTYSAPKLLVRKTGVGISAAIDYTTSFTNQVVYIFRLQKELAARVPLELFLGILNSRAIYYYLAKKHGETEWRSHPYITQTQILQLPAPDLGSLRNGRSHMVAQMVDLLSPYTAQNLDLPARIDAKVERIVADMYGLGRKDYEAVYNTLDSVQELLPVRALKKISVADIFP